MSWGLDLRDSEVYVLLNGRRARDINTGEEFGAVEFLDHGRTADELWVSNHKDIKSYFKFLPNLGEGYMGAIIYHYYKCRF